MNCNRIRPLLALLVGNDLDPREASTAREHLAKCPRCQSQFAGLQASTSVLHSLAAQPASEIKEIVSRETASKETAAVSGPARLHAVRRESLWEGIGRQLRSRFEPASQTSSNESAPSWLTIGGFSMACAVVLWLTLSTPVFEFDLPNEVGFASTQDQLSFGSVPGNGAIPGAAIPGAGVTIGRHPQIQPVGDSIPLQPLEINADGQLSPVVRPVPSARSLFEPRSF